MDTKTVHSPRGVEVELEYREDTNDLAVIGSTFKLWGQLHDEYELQWIRTDGLLLDIGAHIGTVSIAFLLDNPNATAVAVEPMAENIAVMKANAKRAGVSDRLRVIEGAIGTTEVMPGPGIHRYIGNQIGGFGDAQTVKQANLRNLKPDVVKIDCEGCEWSFFETKTAQNAPLIIGEYHSGTPDQLRAILPDHDLTIVPSSEGFGTFRAVRRG